MSPPEHWKEISALYAAALERRGTERAAFLHEACGGDESLLHEVTSLLECHDDAQQSLTSTAAQVIVNAMTTEAVSLAGRQLGAYRLEAPLATGGMGEVYRAVDTRLHRPVAIKILPHHLREDAARRERFEREAQAVAALRHPHICVLYDVGQADGIDFLVMELLDGETLADRLTRGPLPLDDALLHAGAIADALVATHRAGIVHRDLKPGNIMLTESGPKLLDFGLAKLQRVDESGEEKDSPATPPARGQSTPTAFGGTLPYMTPEQLACKEVDHRSDIFAFGAVLYEMVTGQRAFDGADRDAVLTAIRTVTPIVLSPDISAAAPGLDALIEKCLRKDPADRWQDTAAMADALRALAGTSRSATRWLRLSRKRAAAVAALLAVAAIVAGTLMWRAGRASPPPAPAPSRQLTFTGAATLPEIDLNGRFVAYWNNDSLLVQDVSGGDPIEVFQGTPMLSWSARWSPNGSQLVVPAAKGMFLVPRAGDTPQQIGSNVLTTIPVWRDDSTIAGIEDRAIIAHDVTGTGERTVICDLLGVTTWSGLDWSPAQNAFLVISTTNKNVRSSLRTFRSSDCRSTLIVDLDGRQISQARWASDGKAIYYLIRSDPAGALWKARVGSSVELLGTPMLVRDGITGPFSMSSRNTLVHERRTTSVTIRTYFWDRNVTEERNLLRRPDARYGPVIGRDSDGGIYVQGENPREVLRIPAAGGLATHVVTLPEPPLAAYSIDSVQGRTRFRGAFAETHSDIWLAENFDPDR